MAEAIAAHTPAVILMLTPEEANAMIVVLHHGLQLIEHNAHNCAPLADHQYVKLNRAYERFQNATATINRRMEKR